jgi:dTDP-4-amino-4,6-dideoxygalactose transaminase
LIRLTIPSIEEDDLQAVRDSLASGLLVQGPRVAAFEDQMAAMVGTKHAVAVSNCTTALYLALLALNVRTDDLCLVTAYSWVSTANVIEWCGARPVFIDIDPASFNINPDHLEAELAHLMTKPEVRGNVKAVLPVHTFGQMADMMAINRVCNRWDIPVIEDAACALGAMWAGQQAGSWGSMGCFSFHPRKSITMGEGGLITSDDGAIVQRLRALRNHGIDPAASVQDFIMPGHNCRLTEFQAALGSSQLAKLNRITQARIVAAKRYDEILTNTPLMPPRVKTGATHVYQSYVTLLPPEVASRRDDIIRLARKAGVEMQIGTVHIPLTTFYRKRYGYHLGDFPVADGVARCALTLPLFEGITIEQQETVVNAICKLI